MSAVYRVTLALPKAQLMTVRVKADDRIQAKQRALNQARSMGHHPETVVVCRKESKPTVFGNWPAPPIGGKQA